MTAAEIQIAAAASIATLASFCRGRVRVEPTATGVRLRGEFKTLESIGFDLATLRADVRFTDVPDDVDAPCTMEVS